MGVKVTRGIKRGNKEIEEKKKRRFTNEKKRKNKIKRNKKVRKEKNEKEGGE